MPDKKKLISNCCFFLLTIGIALYVNYHEIIARNFFFADDWAWLYFAEFRSYSDLFSLLPRQIYNDRPVGAIFIKFIYDTFGLNYEAFLFFQIFLHGVNSILLYIFAKKYIGNVGSLIAAGVSAAWVSANAAAYWTGAMFDLLGATLCLLSLLFWQLSRRSKFKLLYVCAGAAMYFLAVRSKEFAIGLPLLIFIINTLLDRRSRGEAVKDLGPYLVVMLVLGSRYIYLLVGSGLVGDSKNIYGLDYSSILGNSWVYFSKLFYSDAFGWIPSVVALSIMLIASLTSFEYRRMFFVCMCGFLMLLGPTLLLSNHLDALYLYAPHYFIAFSIGALCVLGWHGKLLSFAAGAILVIAPINSLWYANVSNFNDSKSSKNLHQYNSLFRVIGHFEAGSRVYIYGLEPYFNPFSYGPGNSLKIRMRDPSLSVRIEEEKEVLIAEFCSDAIPKYFISYEGFVAKDQTSTIKDYCKQLN